jgi:hypothetical protein
MPQATFHHQDPVAPLAFNATILQVLETHACLQANFLFYLLVKAS